MTAVEKCGSLKTAAEQQKRAALPRVVAHHFDGAREECQWRGNGPEESVEFTAATRGRSGHEETNQKQYCTDKSIDENSSPDSVYPGGLHQNLYRLDRQKGVAF